jgi:hypothetical protein
MYQDEDWIGCGVANEKEALSTIPGRLFNISA